jgi:riboflavin synthase
MFTGIVTDIGEIKTIAPLDQGIRLRIGTEYDPAFV